MYLDSEQDKPFDNDSGIKYIIGHTMALNYFTSRFRIIDKSWIVEQFLSENPALLASMLKNNYETSETQRVDLVIKLLCQEGTFTIMFGLPRHGKTASAVWLIEKLLKLGYKVYWFGYSPALKKAYPTVIQTFNLKEIYGTPDEPAVLIYDEMILSMFGRDAISSEVKERVTSFPTAGHSGYAVIGLSQSTRVDPLYKDLLTFIWFKPFTINGVFEKSMQFRPYVRYLIPHLKSENLIYNITSNECFMFNNDLPLKWNDEISKSFAPIRDRNQSIEYANLLMEAGISDRDLRKFLHQRNIDVDLIAEYLDNDLTKCPRCNSTDFTKAGTTDEGIQKRKCKNCKKIYYEEKEENKKK